MKRTAKIRINELARELEVKAGAIIDCLPGFGVEEPKTHSSSLEEEVANKVREVFRRESADKDTLASSAETPPPAPASARRSGQAGEGFATSFPAKKRSSQLETVDSYWPRGNTAAASRSGIEAALEASGGSSSARHGGDSPRAG